MLPKKGLELNIITGYQTITLGEIKFHILESKKNDHQTQGAKSLTCTHFFLNASHITSKKKLVQ